MSAHNEDTRGADPLLEEENPDGDYPGLPAPEETILRMRQKVIEGSQHWFEALLDAVGRWRVPAEDVRGREFRYLVGGEAFDWLLLAERLLDEMPDLVPLEEREALLFDGLWPIEMDDDEFAEHIGQAKHSAHLNYLYGVLVEQALQLHVEEEIHKEARARVWGQDPREDLGMYSRVYDKTRTELVSLYYEETGTMLGEHVSYPQWRDFIYWLFRLRMRRQDKARVASDTRKGLAQLSRMELAVSERRRGAKLDEAEFFQRFEDTIDGYARTASRSR
ncbi:MAG: hypothetical protein U5Q44_10945 [Dehalococcoidia bacterium]|nr:hypothetical protein [Dehalococcoidia bacterium]